jgi:autotransporter-associated beta strand protein
MTLTDSLLATVNNVTATSAAGALNLTATIAGPGGFTKAGDGLATFGTGAKTYGGATILSGGRMRISLAAAPTATSSFTINAGAQLDLISAGTYTFGLGPLNLNGSGAITGPFAIFPGAIRNDTNLAVTINNSVVLQSNTLLHVEGSATGSLTFVNSVSGPGSLTLAAPASSANQGQLVLNGSNSYLGGTFVNGGALILSGAAATLGAGNVTVDDLLSPLSIARLTIQSSGLDAIADTATLTLAGGGVGGLADENFADLGAGINEIVAGLMLGGAAQGPGTYGSNASTATFKSDEYFSGTGIVTVVPEPGALPMLLGGLGGLLGLRRRKTV